MPNKTIVITEKPNILTGLNENATYQEISPREYEEFLRHQDEARDREEKHSRYTEWTQLNLDNLVVEHLDLLSKNKTAMRLFFFILKHMDEKNALLASYRVFQESLQLSKASIQRGIKYLIDNHIIFIKKSGSANIYLLNPDIAWKSWGTNYKYCEFPANVLLAKSEQPEPPQEDQKKPQIKDKRLKTVEVNE